MALLVLGTACGARTGLDELEVEGPEPGGPPRCGDGVVQPFEACDDGSETDGPCAPDCRLRTCGDGVVDPGEACDRGEANEDRPALGVRHGAHETPLVAYRIETGPAAFYQYTSKSAHTGFEEARTSRLFFLVGPGSVLSIVTLHGIDVDATGEVQPMGRVDQRFSDLPLGTGVAFSDDTTEEFGLTGGLEARGEWVFERNTDGGVLSGMPFPGTWAITVRATFTQGVDTWEALGGPYGFETSPVALAPAEPAILFANESPSDCRLDCSVPRCGDGRLDGGEVCDDGNTASGDGCRDDCAALR